MGAVWQARDELLNREVAVKEIIWPPQMEPAERETARGRAVREAQMAARLSHPNVVSVFDIVEEDGRPWIVMEYMPFRSLRDVVAEDGPLPPGRAARIGLGILAALRAAHGAGVLHRDVKPANVLLGPGDRAVLTDFGIARATDSPAVTSSGIVIGSPSYIAPERAHGGRTAPAGDLWGLGATLYAAVEGRPPFDREGAIASLTAVVTAEPDPPRRAGPLWPVISALLRKDPRDRPGAAEVEQMLRPVAGVSAEPGAAAPPEPAAPDRVTPVLSQPAVSPAGGTEQGGMPAPQAPRAHSPAAPPGPAPSRPAALEPDAPEAAPSEPPSPEPPSPEPPSPEPPLAEPALPYPGPRGPGQRPPGDRRRFRAVLAGLSAVAVAVAAVAAGLSLTRSPRHQPGAAAHPPRPGPTASAAGPSPGSPGSPTPASGSAPAASGGPAPVPAGYHRFTDPTGFSIAVPRGWQISHAGHYVYIRDPADPAVFLLIDQSAQPKPNPLADWRQQAASRESSYPDYHLIRLQAVGYAQAEKAADWEFRYDRNGQPVQVLNRNVLANAHHAYALYWSTPESVWNADFRFFQVFAATFRPAGGSQGG